MFGSNAAVKGTTHHLSKPRAAIGAALMLLAFPVQAQYVLPPWAYQYYHGDYPPPPGPPGNEGPMYVPPGYYPPNFTVSEIRRRVARLGLHLVAKPKRKDNIYLAEAEDPNGVAHRLVFDAEAGRLIENTTLPPRKKKVAAEKPAPAVPEQ